MSENNLRTRIADLPLCEDTDLIDTLIAIGKDGNTYRVNSEDVLTNRNTSSTTCIPISYDFSINGNSKIGSISIPYEKNPHINFRDSIVTGGILHITVNVDYTNIDACIMFDEDCMFQVSTYGGRPVFAIDQDWFFTKKIRESNQTFTRTIVKPEIVNISTNLYVANLNDYDRTAFGFDIKVIDLSTMEIDSDSTFFVSNIYFEPKRVPSPRLLNSPQ